MASQHLLTAWEQRHRAGSPCPRCSLVDEELICTALDVMDQEPMAHAMSHTDIMRHMYHLDET